MALELITGRAGKAHIGSEDDRAYHANVNGDGRYVLHGGTAEISNANNVHIDPTEFLVDGAHVRITGAGEDVTIDNGVSSYKRIDVIALHYTRVGGEDDYVESIALTAVKGANVEPEASPVVPEMPTSTTILEGSADVYIPIFQLLIDGLTPKDLTALLKPYALPIANGGTGQNTAAEIRNVLGLGNTTAALPVANGGTGSNNASAARNALGITPTNIGAAPANYIPTKIKDAGDSRELTLKYSGTQLTSAEWFAAWNGNQLRAIGKSTVGLQAYPVGAVYISYNSTSPAQLFGGSWTPITGRFPYFNAGTSTGGSNTHTLTQNEIPTTKVLAGDAGLVNEKVIMTIGSGASGGGRVFDLRAGSIGRGNGFTTMPAYQTLYAWRRTA